MAAVNVRQLSDLDLRDKLRSFGVNVGPVTATTRGVLEKKLSKILENKNDSNGNISSNLNASETDEVKKSSVSKGRRASSIGRKYTPNTTKFAPFSSDDDDETYNRSNRKTQNKSKSDFVDPNDTNIVIKPPATSTPYNSINSTVQSSRNKRKSIQNNSVSSRLTTDPLTSTNIESSGRISGSFKNDFSDDDFISTIQSPTSQNYDMNNTKRSTVQQNSRYRKNESKGDASYTHEHIAAGTPIQSRPNKYDLSASNNLESNNSVPNMRDEIDASLIQIRKSFATRKPSPTRMYNVDRKEKCEGEELDAELGSETASSFKIFRGFVIPGLKVLSILIACIFFGLYVYNWNDNAILGISYEANKKDNDNSSILFINCLYQKLSVLAGDAECGYIESRWLKKDSLLDFAGSCSVEMDGDEIIDILNKTYKAYFELNADGDLSSKSSYRSLFCRIYQALSVIAFRFTVIITVISCLIGGYFIMKKRWTADDEEMRQILHFVERIIDTLQRHHEVCQANKDLPPFLPIPHVRDMLIPLARRKKLGKIWRKAVAFLNSSDSRVRVETQRIAGEDFDVWRWIGVCTPKLKKEKKPTNETYLTNDQEKCWQGPAFDEIEKVVRMPIVTPTPCLKIRYMHEGLEEKDEKWVRRVENAVLEKCNADGAQILHIFVDRTSKEGCVYVKCDSLESAGKAFRCMYGNWFDCRLVIVKFVTLARYHQRFPDALRCVEPLKADSAMPSSLNWVAEDNK